MARLIGFLALLLCSHAWAQSDSLSGRKVKVIGGYRTLSSQESQLRPEIGFDARNSFINHHNVRIGGVRVGIQLDRVHRLGFANYFLIDRIFDYNPDPKYHVNRAEYTFKYFSIWYERVLYYDPHWEFSTTLNVGGGQVQVFYNPNGGNDRVRIDRIPVNPFELTVNGQYNILPWLAVGAGAGERITSGGNPEMRRRFTGPIYIFKVNIRFVKLAWGYLDGQSKTE